MKDNSSLSNNNNNSGERVTVDEEVSNSDDLQGSEENRSHKRLSITTINIK
ncbi:MAG: hypothetical protein WBQ25_07190 [Nitrososphaeraceae archaeon]